MHNTLNEKYSVHLAEKTDSTDQKIDIVSAIMLAVIIVTIAQFLKKRKTSHSHNFISFPALNSQLAGLRLCLWDKQWMKLQTQSCNSAESLKTRTNFTLLF
jgi:uncharacterized membrane protein YraQ (UPF0718 family)